MLGSDVLEVAIGLIFLFFILSIVLTAGREVIEGFLQTRAIHLERGVRELLKDEDGSGLARQLYEHPIVSSLFRGAYEPGRLTKRYMPGKDPWLRMPFRTNLPAYIPTRNFALALLDIVGRGEAGDGDDSALSFASVRAGIDRIADPRIRRAVLLALDGAKGDLDQARTNLEKWFDSGMDRVSGWYRKETQGILLVMGLVTAVLLNIDAVHVARTLYENDTLRATIVADAAATTEQARAAGVTGTDQQAMLKVLGCGPELEAAAAAPSATANVSCAERRVRGLGLPIGWERINLLWPANFKGDWSGWFATFPWLSIPGWILTALAISLGAPFWFDLLNKIMVIRSTVKPHEKSPEEASEDRQAPKGAVAGTGAGAAAGPRELDDGSLG